MWHALLNLAARQPQLLSAHAEAYVELLGAQCSLVSASWTRRCLLDAAALAALAVATVLAGVATLLWAALPELRLPWALLGLPLLPLGVALACAWVAHRGAPLVTFDPVLQQLRADLLMLREADTP